MLSLTGAEWRVPDARGLDHLQAARPFAVAASWDHLHDPFAMLNMDRAVRRIRHAIQDMDRIRIVTDYDVDGTTSSLIIQAALNAADCLRPPDRTTFHIPSRFGEGYGFSVTAAERAVADGVDLIITADIGVRDHAAVKFATDHGVDVIVVDHHLPPGCSVPPDAIVLCPPQDGDPYPNRALAACGVSYKLAQAILDDPSDARILRSLLKLAAIGTVADMVSLATPENRAIVALGLDELNRGQHTPGLQALLDVAGCRPGGITAGDLGFKIGPRINAAGRMSEAKLIVDLLQCRDRDHAAGLAQVVDHLNSERREVQGRLVDDTLARVRDTTDAFVVVDGSESDGWHRGVMGIVASRLKDELARPVAVVSVMGDRAVGSVRSVPAVHAVRALESAADLLVKFGGHPMAAGFTVPTEHLGALRDRLNAYAAEHSDPSAVRVRDADAVVDPYDIDVSFAEAVAKLEPFGQGNPAPRFVVPGVRPLTVRPMGKDRTHMRVRVSSCVDAVWWNSADRIVDMPPTMDLLGRVEVNEWGGVRRAQLVIEDVRSAA